MSVFRLPWLVVRTLLLAAAAWFFSIHSASSVEAVCASSCGGAIINPDGSCQKGPTCTAASKGQSGQGCTVEGCACKWDGSNCTGGS